MAKTIYRDEVHLGYVDLSKNELRNARVQNLGAAPASPVTGQLYYDTGTNKLFWWNGTSWIDATGAAGAILASLLDTKGDLIAASANDTPAKLPVGTDGQILVAASGQATGLLWRDAAVSDVKNVTTDTLLGRDTAGTGAGELIGVGGGLEFTGAAAIRIAAFTGDVTKAAGGTALTIAADAVQRSMMANMAQSTVMGRAAGAGTGDPTDLTPAQVKALLGIAGTDVSFTPADTISSTDVQSAIVEALTDARSYSDSLANGFDVKASVRVATTANIAVLAGGAPSTIEGVTLVANDRILVKDQTTGSQNGIYIVTTVGTGANGEWTRAADANTSAEVTAGMFTWVEEGTVNADTGWVLTTNNPITLGTTALVFTQFSGLGQITAGAALTKTGNTLDVNVDTTTIEINADTLRIAAAAAGAGLGGGGASALSVNVDGTTIEISSDTLRLAATAAGNGLTGGGGSALAVGAGTGIVSNANDVAIDTAVVVRKYVASITGGALTEVITHNLNTRDITVALVNNATPWDSVDVEWEATSVNTVTLRSPVNLPASYRVVVHG